MQASEVVAILNGYRERRKPLSYDLEGYPDKVSCYAIADSPHEAVVVPFIHPDGSSVWDEEDEIAIWQATADLMQDPEVPKILQNYLYDAFVLLWSYGIVIEGLQDDTMLGHFELFCELEKSLGFQASIYTKEPFYKSERKSTDELTQLIYCGKDAAVTFECNEAIHKLLKPQQQQHYKFNIELLAPLLYMEARGMRYDYEEAKRRLAETQEQIYVLQDQINQEAARSESRIALRQFYSTLGCDGTLHRGRSSPSQTGERSCTVEAGGGPAGLHDDGAPQRLELDTLLPLLTAAFCCCERDRAEWREVEETSWQPCRWNGKRWVKAGKQIPKAKALFEAIFDDDEKYRGDYSKEPPTSTEVKWWKPITKHVRRRLPVAVSDLRGVRRFRLDSRATDCSRALGLLGEADAAGTTLSPAQRGELATLLGIHVKISASGRDKDDVAEDGTVAKGDERDANWFLYTHCNLPKQWIKEGIRNTDRLASDGEAVIKAWIAGGRKDDRAITFAKLKKLLTEVKALRAKPDADGRIRCSYNLVGTETHRLSCSGSPTRTSKLNLQTVTKSHRVLYVADPGHVMCQRDLAGADGWCVAAYAAMLGDRTMLDDYRAKLKPAQIIVLMLDRGAAVNQLTRDELKPLCKPITEEADWRYFAMKRVQHGSSYQMGKNTTSDQILTDSYKKDGTPLYMAPKECERIQRECFFVRYPGIKRWHEWMASQISTQGSLTASNGFTRRFFGRKTDNGTVRQALAHLPQVYTTYATTLALARLWGDPGNRNPDGSLIVEPLHTVHDSLITQWPVAMTEWAKVKMVAWFDNPIDMAQERIIIPASGTYGPSWGEQGENL